MNRVAFPIDLRNPGHFFACCGMLYCADHMFGIAKGCFKEDEFCLEADCKDDPLDEMMLRLNTEQDPIKADTDDFDSPLYLSNIPMRLDFWNHFDNRPKIKLFAGQEKSKNLLGRWTDHLRDYDKQSQKGLLGLEVLDLPSGFDTSTSWNALDVGFSLNMQGMNSEICVYPLVEFFAYVGVQTYSWEERNFSTYRYRVWNTPLSSMISIAVSSGALVIPDIRCFEFNTEKSGQKKILKRAKEISV